MLAFALLISLLTGALFGLAPAIHSTRSELAMAVREGARGSGDSTRTGRLRDALIVSELAFAVVLMVGAGLLLRTLRELLQENPGFNPTQVVAADIWLPVPNDPKADPYLKLSQQTAFKRELQRRMNAIPGVQLAGNTSDLPTTSQTNSDALTIEDRPLEASQDLRAERIWVSPDLFQGDAGLRSSADASLPKAMKTANSRSPLSMKLPLVATGLIVTRWAGVFASDKIPSCPG